MTKTTHDMNKIVKHTAYSIKVKDGCGRNRQRKTASRIARCLLMAIMPLGAQSM